jgi:hypothetical protein
MICVFFKLVNLIKMTYLTIYQIDHFGQNGQWVLAKWSFNQIGQNKMLCMIKINNDFLVKLNILY